MFNKNVRHILTIFVLLTLYVGLCLEAAALEEMAVGDIHEFEGGYWIKVEGADLDGKEEATFALYKEGREVDVATVSCGDWFSLNDEGCHFEAILDSVFDAGDTVKVRMTDYGWECGEPEPETPAVPTPWPMPEPTPIPGPDFAFYLIIFLVFSLAIGLPLIFVIYRKGKKIEEYRAKMEEWEKEGYDVSELKEVLEGKK